MRILLESLLSQTEPAWYRGRLAARQTYGNGAHKSLGLSRELKVLGRNALGEMTLASPAVANGSVIIRTATRIYRIARAAR